MRKFIFLIVVSVTFFTCSDDNDTSPDFYLEVMPVKSVKIPLEFINGKDYEIVVSYMAPSSCYEFNDFTFQGTHHERTVGIVNSVYTEEKCKEVPEEVEVSFDFSVTGADEFVFKFFTGLDAQGKHCFNEVRVPVID